METNDPKVVAKFDPTLAKLHEMVAETEGITATDLKDKAQLKAVRESRITLKTARVQIEKAGKAAREDALKFQKDVIAYEKKLIGVITPEEDRLGLIEEEAEKLAIREDRLAKMPARIERIQTVGLTIFHDKTEEEMLELDANGFEAYFNELGGRKVRYDAEQEQIKHYEAAKKLAAENARKQAEQDARDAEQAERAAELKAQEDKLTADRLALEHEKEVAQAKKDTEERMKREGEEKAAAEKAADDKKAAYEAVAEKVAYAKLAKDKEYQAFLKNIGMTKTNTSNFHKIETVTEIIIYKKVGTFKK